MFNSFKITIRKWAGLPFQDVMNLLTWSDGESVDFGNRNLLIASASRDGQTVAYLVAEPTLIISNNAVDPRTSPSDVRQIGESIDAALAEKATEIGAERFMIVLPNEAPTHPDEHVLRVVHRKIPQNTTITCDDGSTIKKRFSVDPRTNTAKFIN